MGDWSFIIDPAWQPPHEGAEPPFEAVVGGWFRADDGRTGLFRPNPAYQPSRPGLPTDPVDAALQRLATSGSEPEAKPEGSVEALLSALQDVLFGVAVDEQGIALVVPAPDGVPSVLVATAPAHRHRVDTPAWREVGVAELAAALPPEGVDVLLNPGSPTSTRLTAAAVRSAAHPVRSQPASPESVAACPPASPESSATERS